MADVGFARHVGHRHAVADLALAQVGVEDHRGLVGRAEAARPRRSADDDRARVLDELLVALPSLRRVVLAADGLREAVGTQARDFLERQARAGRDHQVVVGEFLAIVERELRYFGVDCGDRVDEPLDALAFRAAPASRPACPSGFRQPTAIQGLDGVNSKWGRAPISVTRWSLGRCLRRSNAAGIPPSPAPMTTT